MDAFKEKHALNFPGLTVEYLVLRHTVHLCKDTVQQEAIIALCLNKSTTILMYLNSIALRHESTTVLSAVGLTRTRR